LAASHIIVEKTGSLIMSGFNGTSITPELKNLIVDQRIGGFILFERNYESPTQLHTLIKEMQSLAVAQKDGCPLFISVDQEGGRVCRLKAPFSDFPSQNCLGISKSEDLAYRFGQSLAVELKSVGINMDYAPILDVNSNPQNPIIGKRAISGDPDLVSNLGAAIIRGFLPTGVLPVGKHFPGHGDTDRDSHLELPTVNKSADELENIELKPFIHNIEKGLEVIMTAHVLYPAWDKDYPATFSKTILLGILRKRLKFQGLIISDDLEMKAVENLFEFKDFPVLGFEAGLDQFMICNNVEKTVALQEQMIRDVEKGKIASERIEESLDRTKKIKSRLTEFVPQTPPDFSLWSGPHGQVIKEMKEFIST
jgi:beta-N-acetylhexosaminidase